MDREVAFSTYPRLGQGKRMEKGSVATLLRHIPYLLLKGFIPPLPVVNEVLRSGGVDAGMSGAVEWTAFELGQKEFQTVIDELSMQPANGITYLHEPVPDWVLSQDDWTVWLAHRINGVPIDENIRLTRSMKALRERMRSAEAAGDENERIRWLLELNAVCMEWSKLIDKHRPDTGDP